MADITKEYTINVPDELWVDKHDDSNTATYTYEGPDTVWVATQNETTPASWSDVEFAEDSAEKTSGQFRIIEVDCNDQPEIGHWIQPLADDFQHTFEDETNAFDDSTYKRITNPSIRDWMDLIVDPNDTTKVKLTPIYKRTHTKPELKAMARKAYVEKYNGQYAFTTEQQASIDTFLSDINTYIASYADCYPWKFTTISEGNMPQIPADLSALFESIPSQLNVHEEVGS
tara:strand:+ start:1661 stop:2347 length:687 start_codon:yes stop_codon:yes gene_type:complete